MNDILSVFPEEMKGVIESIELKEPADEIFKIVLDDNRIIYAKEADWAVYFNACAGDCVIVDEVSGIIKFDENRTKYEKNKIRILQNDVFN